MIQQLVLGIILAGTIAFLAYRARSLTLGGAVAALILGTLVFGFGGISWAILLIGFFISSSALSRLFKRQKAALDEKFSKGSQRDGVQVLANGGIAGFAVLLHLVFPVSTVPWLAFAGTLAAVNADTWATELGVLGRNGPRLITNGKQVDRGTSGGISLVGTLAALGGSAFIALLAVLTWKWATGVSENAATLTAAAAVVILAGGLGSLFDSFLGATVQVIYTCPACQKETERSPRHSCGSTTIYKRGWRWLNNDWVNAACAAAGAVLALAAGFLIPAVWGPAPQNTADLGSISIAATGFKQAESIPLRFTCDEKNLSPELRWGSLPSGTRSLALVMDDPDAPLGVFTHWVLYNMPPSMSNLPEGISSIRAGEIPGYGTQGRNSMGNIGYTGPCPPPGKPHRYFFTLYSLDLLPDLPQSLTVTELRDRIQAHILASGQWMGVYGR